jgi:hypothetical protein
MHMADIIAPTTASGSRDFRTDFWITDFWITDFSIAEFWVEVFRAGNFQTIALAPD